MVKIMIIRKRFVVYLIIITLFVGLIFFNQNSGPSVCTEIELNQFEMNDDSLNNKDQQPQLSENNNYQILEDVFQKKLSDYQTLGYFPQFYESSLQATYYALYILEAIGKINQINQTQLTTYITSLYNCSSHVFMDRYAYRYLDSNASVCYYPLTSVLEINCYALLSLDLLGTLTNDLIDFQESIDFIWSCYNPITSGFVGQPYSSNLNEYFRTSTLDNTYYAIKALKVLTNWSLYPDQKSDLVNFINGLQSTFSWEWQFGGFLNDYNTNFVSLYGFDTNLFSCYYAIKSLEIFNLIETINLVNFHQYLSGLYDPTKRFFRIDYMTTNNDTNLAASAIGLELSKLTQYTECDRNGVVSFLLNHRNSYSTWDCSTQSKNRELIDAFEIVRSLKDIGEILKLSLEDKVKIADTIQKYFHYKSFSLISNDYMSLNLMYTIVNSFDIYDKISDLPINYLYNHVLNSSIYGTIFNYLSFHSCVDLYSNAIFEFRSKPLEYYTDLEHEYVLDNNKKISHKSTYYALDSLLKLFKLDDFELKYNLNDLVDSILNSQFLDTEYENYGAFLPTLLYQGPAFNSEFRNEEIEFEYSYYAIRALELLVGYLQLGSICDLSFNKNGLYNYIINKIVDTGTTIYYNTNYHNDIAFILKNTYYAIYVLKALNLFGLNVEKIKNFVDQNVDYTNVENIYYCYKIFEILGLEYCFNLECTHQLIQEIYSEDLNEFFLNQGRILVDQEVFFWICEMARNNALKIDSSCKNSIYLGDLNKINVTFSNIILDDFGPYITVKFESNQMGTLILEEQQDERYQVNFLVPINPNYYPLIDGFVRIYDKNTLIGEKYLSFQTIYELIVNNRTKITNNGVFFEVNMSYISFTGPSPASSSIVVAEVYKNNTFLETQNFNRKDYVKHSVFTLNYQFEEQVYYEFNIKMSDDYHSDNFEVLDYSYNYSISAPPPTEPEPEPEPDPEPEPQPEPTPIISRKWLNIIFISTVFAISCIIVFGTRYYIKKGAKKAKNWFKEKFHKKKGFLGEGEGEVEVIIKKKVRPEDIRHFFNN